MIANTSTPTHPTDGWTLNRGLRWSLIGHVALVLFVLIKSLVFPSDVRPYIPSLRVDLVGLPDALKKDIERMKSLPMPKAGEPEETAPEPKSKSAEKAEPDELVLNPKKAKDEKKSKETDEERVKARTKNALARIKALAKINDAEDSKSDESDVVKGNQLSKGSSLAGNARENTEQGYLDLVLTRLQDNWALPSWLARQNLQAQVQAFIDNRGHVRRIQFIKSSGNAQFDDAVKKAVMASEPFPIPPVDLRGSLLSHGILLGFPL